MALIETEGLVLKTYNLSEADKIAVVLTRDHGVIRGVAKGAKRLQSKFGSGLEPFSVVQGTYFQKDAVELVSIQKIDLVESNFQAASNPEFLNKFSYLAETLISISPPHDPNDTLYRMVRACLTTATADPANLTGVGVYFEIWLLKIAGYWPDWTRCRHCGRQLGASDIARLAADFHLTCDVCPRPRAGEELSARQRGVAVSAMKLSPDAFCVEAADMTAEMEALSVIFKRMLALAAGREVRN